MRHDIYSSGDVIIMPMSASEILLLMPLEIQNFYRKRLDILNIIKHPIDLLLPSQLINNKELVNYIYLKHFNNGWYYIYTNTKNDIIYNKDSVINDNTCFITYEEDVLNIAEINEHVYNDYYHLLNGLTSLNKFGIKTIFFIMDYLGLESGIENGNIIIKLPDVSLDTYLNRHNIEILHPISSQNYSIDNLNHNDNETMITFTIKYD